MKYLYCPRCKELRVKSWYQIRNRCQFCFSDAAAIKIPNTWMTYLLYLLYVISPALVGVYVWNHDRNYLYSAVVALAVMIVVNWLELGRGLAYAKAKIKIVSTKSDDFRRRGWGQN